MPISSYGNQKQHHGEPGCPQVGATAEGIDSTKERKTVSHRELLFLLQFILCLSKEGNSPGGGPACGISILLPIFYSFIDWNLVLIKEMIATQPLMLRLLSPEELPGVSV